MRAIRARRDLDAARSLVVLERPCALRRSHSVEPARSTDRPPALRHPAAQGGRQPRLLSSRSALPLLRRAAQHHREDGRPRRRASRRIAAESRADHDGVRVRLGRARRRAIVERHRPRHHRIGATLRSGHRARCGRETSRPPHQREDLDSQRVQEKALFRRSLRL